MTEPIDSALPDLAFPVEEEAHAPEPAELLALQFSGSGAEYFRIWIVNLMLSVATLGIYSAWAKTRRLQYFYRNTSLAGASFDFRGDPRAILRGRILALVLVAAYQYAFGFSVAAGAVTVGLLLLALPFLMRSALRFRLANTWYRGLPFGFDGGIAKAYLAYLVPVAIFVLPGALFALTRDARILGAFSLLYLFWPLMHGVMKRYQHGHLLYGDLHAGFAPSAASLAKPYLFAFLFNLGAIVVFVAVVGVTAVAGRGAASGTAAGANLASGIALILGTLLLYLCFLFSGLYILVRMNNRAWSGTAFPGIAIDCRMRVRGYLRLQVVNVLLTVFTLGLFRPFAAVRTWRYRVDHVRIDAPGGFEQASVHAGRRPASAAGDGAADFLGVDLSW